MRTLKKTLCLVLALVMVLGLCAINVAATSYTDDASIGADYREAVEVLTAIGVFNGKDDGSIGPQDSLTRVQGCYLICKMLGAPNGAGFTSFTDVSAQDSPVVAYCQTLGIAAGYGDNTFHPYDPLTGAAFAKWCLVALGYNAAIEGMTGLGWVGNTQNLTTMAALAEDIAGYDPTVTLTREQAAQMCLNTLEATMVEYKGNVTVSSDDGLNVTVNGGRSDLANQSGTDYRYGNGATVPGGRADETMQFVEMYFPQLKLNDETTEVDGDNLNTPLKHIWIYRGNETFRTLDTPVISYTGKTNRTTVSADLSSYYIVGQAKGNEKMYITNAKTYPYDTLTDPTRDIGTRFFLNGVYDSLDTTSGVVGSSVLDGTNNTLRITNTNNTKSLAEVFSDITANGRKVDFYAGDKNDPNHITEVVVTIYTVAKINGVTTNGNTTTYTFIAAETGEYVNFGANRRTYNDAPADNSVITTASLAKGDYVTVTYPGCNASNLAPKLHVYATEMFTGVQTSRSSSNTVIVDGTTYNVAAGVFKTNNGTAYSGALSTATNNTDFANSNSTSNFYMDQFGYLVHSDAVANGNYAFIVGATGKVSSDVDGMTPEIRVRAVLSDGTVGTYKVATEKWSAEKVGNVLYNTDATHWSRGPVVTKAGHEKDDVYLIKNTDILVGTSDAVASVDTTTWDDKDNASHSDANVDDAAKLLMGEAYGYVYNYTLNGAGDTITLYPVSDYANLGYTDTFTPIDGEFYTGETDEEVLKGTTSYVRYQNTDGSVNNYGAPKTYHGSESGTVNNNNLLVNVDTPIIIYNSDSKTATVSTGLSNLPGTTGKSGHGYFVGAANGSNAGDSLTARAIFVTKDGGVIASTSEYLFIDALDYRAILDDNGNVDYYTYRAWHENGESDTDFYVKDIDDKYLEAAAATNNGRYSGLYTISANNEITDAKLSQQVGTPAKPEPGDPYTYVTSSYDSVTGYNKLNIQGNMIEANGMWLYLDNVTFVYPYNDIDNDNCNGAYIVAEVSGNELTGYAKTIYVV